MALIMGTILLVGLINPWSFIPAGFGLLGMLIVRHRSARCFRDLQRIQGMIRSPVYSYLSATIHGLKVIRSYCAEKICLKEFLYHLDNHSRANFLIIAVERWAAVRLEYLTLMFLMFVTIFSVFVRL